MAKKSRRTEEAAEDTPVVEDVQPTVAPRSARAKKAARRDAPTAPEESAAEGAAEKAPEWTDEADEVKGAKRVPEWMRSKEGEKKKHAARDPAVQALVASTAPLVAQRADRSNVPKLVGTIDLFKDTAHSMQWHPKGELLIASLTRTVAVFHTSGKFSQKVHQWKIPGRHVVNAQLLEGGEDVVVVQERTHVPIGLNLATGQTTPLKFLSTLDGTPYTIAKHFDSYPHKCCVSGHTVALPHGRRVRMGNFGSATLSNEIHLNDIVTDCSFEGPNHLVVAAGQYVHLYDVRNTTTPAESFVDEGALEVRAVTFSPTSIAVGSSSGIVNIYDRAAPPLRKKRVPMMTLKNLVTPITFLKFTGDASLLLMGSQQLNGFRGVRMPTCKVIPSFPAEKCQFVKGCAVSPTLKMFSISEAGKISHYAF